MPAAIGRDQTIRPVRIDTATRLPFPGLTLPPDGLLTDSTGARTSFARGAATGDAAASVPAVRCQRRRPVSVFTAFSEPLSSRTYSVVW